MSRRQLAKCGAMVACNRQGGRSRPIDRRAQPGMLCSGHACALRDTTGWPRLLPSSRSSQRLARPGSRLRHGHGHVREPSEPVRAGRKQDLGAVPPLLASRHVLPHEGVVMSRSSRAAFSDACAAGRAPLAELRNDASGFFSLAFSADGRWLATSGGKEVNVFDTRTWAQVWSIPGPSIHSLSWDPSGPRLLTGSSSGDASIWTIPSGARIYRLRELGEPIDAVAFPPVVSSP